VEASATTRELPGEKAQRIVEAMRTAVGEKGAAGATFDVVARRAGVSRGLLHYYFSTKERLLAEVVRRDCDIRMQVLDEVFASASDARGLVDGMVAHLESLVKDDPGFIALIFELFSVSRHNEELAAEMAELLRRTRTHVADRLQAASDAGVVELAATPEAVATVLFSLADGLAMRILAEPGHDHADALAAGATAVAALMRQRTG
jgi:AcrR family transcriptional regulator